MIRSAAALAIVAVVAAGCGGSTSSSEGAVNPAREFVESRVADAELAGLALADVDGPLGDVPALGGAAVVELTFTNLDEVTAIEGTILLQDDGAANSRIVPFSLALRPDDTRVTHREPIELDLVGPVRLRATGTFEGPETTFEEAIEFVVEPAEASPEPTAAEALPTLPPTPTPAPTECAALFDLDDLSRPGLRDGFGPDLLATRGAYLALGPVAAGSPQLASIEATIGSLEAVGFDFDTSTFSESTTEADRQAALHQVMTHALDRSAMPVVPVAPDTCEPTVLTSLPNADSVPDRFLGTPPPDFAPGLRQFIDEVLLDEPSHPCPVLLDATGADLPSHSWSVQASLFHWVAYCTIGEDDGPDVALVVGSHPRWFTLGDGGEPIEPAGYEIAVRTGVRLDPEASPLRWGYLVGTGDDSRYAVTYDRGRGHGLAVVAMDGSDPIPALLELVRLWGT